MRTPLALLLLALAAPLGAQEDPLKSPACAAALAQLQAARAAGGTGAGVEEQRSAASATCLGGSAVAARPSRVAQPPVQVPPPQIEVPQRGVPLAAPAPPPAPVAVDRAPGPAICDAGGCWTSGGGTHLRHVPPALAGPQGLCSQQGGVVYCP